MTSPTQRTLAACRKRGWLVQVVERWIVQVRRRVDLFGCIDLVALDGQAGVLGIQATSGDHVAHRVTKIREECNEAAARWLAAGNRLEVWGWSKRGERGKRKLWTCRVVAVTVETLAQNGNEIANPEQTL